MKTWQSVPGTMVGFYLQLWNNFRQINHIRTLEEYPTITMKIWDSGGHDVLLDLLARFEWFQRVIVHSWSLIHVTLTKHAHHHNKTQVFAVFKSHWLAKNGISISWIIIPIHWTHWIGVYSEQSRKPSTISQWDFHIFDGQQGLMVKSPLTKLQKTTRWPPKFPRPMQL